MAAIRSRNNKTNNRSQKSRTIEKTLTNLYRSYTTAQAFEKPLIHEKILDILEKNGFYFENKKYAPLNKEEEKKLLRIDFHGCVNRVKDGLSEHYQSYKTMGKIGEFNIEDYNDLKDWPLWQTAEKSQNFKKIKDVIISYLQNNSIHPASLSHFNTYDFQDILYNTFCEKEDQRVVHIFEGQKQKFVKYMSKTFENQIKQMYIENGISQKKANMVISKMQEFGITDVFSINKHGQAVNDTDIILTVHHKKPVASASQKDFNIFSANDFSNLCLMINNHDFPLHDIIHTFDIMKRNKDSNGNKKEQIIQMLLVPQDCALIIGMHSDFCIFKEFEQRKTVNRAKSRIKKEPQEEIASQYLRKNNREQQKNKRYYKPTQSRSKGSR